MEGYGEKSWANLMTAIEKSRSAQPAKLITALCIPLIGSDAAKKIIKAVGWKGFLERMESGEGFEDVDGIGSEKSGAILNWYSNDENRRVLSELIEIISINDVPPEQSNAGGCAGLSFVITGDVHTFKNRDEFKAYVESQGGSVKGSVSAKTDFLVNNDALSTSSKNMKAKELNIPIITEDEFIARFGR